MFISVHDQEVMWERNEKDHEELNEFTHISKQDLGIESGFGKSFYFSFSGYIQFFQPLAAIKTQKDVFMI